MIRMEFWLEFCGVYEVFQLGERFPETFGLGERTHSPNTFSWQVVIDTEPQSELMITTKQTSSPAVTLLNSFVWSTLQPKQLAPA